MTFIDRLSLSRPVLLDGATGTELNRRGVSTDLPLWSARALIEAPEVLRAVHADYVTAGAELITANTFRTQRRALTQAGYGEQTQALNQLAVALARQATATADHPVWVAGSMSPLEDCYLPELVPPQDACEREHGEHARLLAEAGCDLILVETMNTIREAEAATRAALATGLPVMVGFVCRSDDRLFSGEPVAEAARVIAALGPCALFINCTPSRTIHRPYAQLRDTLAPTGLPTGLYANIGHTDDITGWTDTADVSPAEYADLARGWLDAGARLIGGCCGTHPEHIAAVNAVL